MDATTVAVDLAKDIFEVACANRADRVVERRRLTRRQFEAFLDSLSRSRPACLVLDVHLDGMNGFQLQKRLMEADAEVPIIFITAHDDAGTRARMEQSGAAGHLRKPFDDAALLDLIRRAVTG